MSMKSWIAVLAIVALGLGGYVVWSQYLSGSEEPAQEMMGEAEDLSMEAEDQADEAMEAESESTETTATMASDEGPDAERTALTGVGGFEGSATATRSFDGNTFIHTVRTGEIRDPEPGKFYEGWLVRSSGSPKFFSTGKMDKKDGVFELRYEIAEDRGEYPKIFITEETEADGLDGIPETHILEGSF